MKTSLQGQFAINEDYENLFYYADPRWFCKGHVLDRLMELTEQIAAFFATQSLETAARDGEKLKSLEWRC